MVSNNLIKFFAIFIVTTTIVFLFFFAVVFLFTNTRLSYLKSDYLRYEFFTPDIIKAIPVDLTDCQYEYISPDGTTGVINDIFCDKINSYDIQKLVEYLDNLGFEKKNDFHWKKNNFSITLDIMSDKKMLLSVEER